MKNQSLGKKIKFILLFIIMLIGFWSGYQRGTDEKESANQQEQQFQGTADDNDVMGDENSDTKDDSLVVEDGTYTSKEEVAAYIHLYGTLPSNFITKDEASDLGWVSSKGNLDQVAPGMSIGGDYFGNYEGNLPEAEGREYHECDINYEGGYRGDERIVFSNDGLIYYTDDHYETFELLYGEE